jgi:hypothetical protein
MIMTDIDIKIINELIKKNEIEPDGALGNNDFNPYIFQINSEDFINYAESDLVGNDDKNLVNALSNIKRAVDCQADLLLYRFGLLDKSKKEKWYFPKKMQILNQIGVISPRILGKINKKRNLLEHDFNMLIKEDVEDALDIVILFIEYTKKYIFMYKDMDFITKVFSFNIKLDFENKKIIFEKHKLKGVYYTDIEKKEIEVKNPEYINFLELFIKLYNYFINN